MEFPVSLQRFFPNASACSPDTSNGRLIGWLSVCISDVFNSNLSTVSPAGIALHLHAALKRVRWDYAMDGLIPDEKKKQLLSWMATPHLEVWSRMCSFHPLALIDLFLLPLFRNSTRSTIQPGTALLGGTSAATSHTRQSILFTSTWAKWLSCSSSLAEKFLMGIEEFFSLNLNRKCTGGWCLPYINNDVP